MTILNRFTNNSVKTLTDAPVIEINAEDAPHYQVTITANRTLGNPSNPTFAKDLWIAIAQDVVGGHTLAFQSDWVAIDTTTALNLGTGAISVLHATARNFGSGVKWYYSIDSTNAISGGSGSVAVPNIAALATTAGTGANSTATVLGFYTANDGGGGQFYWVPSGASTPVVGMIVNAPGGQWVRLLDNDDVLNVKWFGAKGDNSNDDTIAIQMAIDNCTPGGGTVYLPWGLYRITDTLRCGYRMETAPESGIFVGNNVNGIHIMGVAYDINNPYEPSTRIIWDSADTTASALWLSGYSFHVEGILVHAAPSRTLACAFELGSFTSVNKFNSSCSWKSCSAQGFSLGTSGHLLRGLAFGLHYGHGANYENCHIDKCLFSNCEISGFAPFSGQPYNTHVSHCYFWNASLGPNQVGVGIEVVPGFGLASGTGSIHVNDCDFQNLESAFYCVQININAHFDNGEYENCKKICYSYWGGQGQVLSNHSFRNARCGNGNCDKETGKFAASDTRMFVSVGGSNLTIDNIVMDSGNVPVFVSVTWGTDLTSINNIYAPTPGAYPLMIEPMGNPAVKGGRFFSTGDRQITGEGPVGVQTTPMAARYGSMFGQTTVTVSDAATTAVVTYQVYDYVTDYKVRVEMESFTGTPPAGALVGYVLSKDQYFFTIAVPVAPGAGNSVTFRVTPYR